MTTASPTNPTRTNPTTTQGRTTPINLTFLGLELRRFARDWMGMFFTAIMPAFFFVIFGSTLDAKDQPIGNGNIAMYVMISMAAYGAVTATTSIGGQAAVERMQGWGRQLGLTPITDRQYVTVKALYAMIVAVIPVLLTYGLGLLMGAEGSTTAWLGSAALVLVGSSMFALYGLMAGSAFRSESAVGVAAGSLVIFAFLGNVFIPLTGVMLTIGKFTPLYGYVTLARYPLTEGRMTDGSVQPLWEILLNVGVWTTVFAILAIYFVRKGRSRQ